MAAAVPYLIVGAVGLIGSWLLTPKSHAQDQAASPMPNVNQALRGTPIFVTFGTNRISAQITWTKNWTAIRQKGGGKGAAKGGGSGGGGAAKGGGAGGSGYNYSWDMIYHFGIMDMPVAVTKGWIGSDRITPATVKGWNSDLVLSGIEENPLFFGGKLFDAVANASAEMQANEVFFAEGYVTGDPLLTSWPYFESQEGLQAAWPTTCWIGFNQLQLGPTPAIPQLSIETTPLASGFDPDANLENVLAGPDLSETLEQPVGNRVFTIGKNDVKKYALVSDVIYNVDEDTHFASPTTRDNWDAEIVAWGGSIDHTRNPHQMAVPNSPYVIVYGNNGGSTQWYVFVFEIDDDGWTRVARVQGDADNSHLVGEVSATYFDGEFLYFSSGMAHPGGFTTCITTWPLGGWIDAGEIAGYHFLTNIVDIRSSTNTEAFDYVGDQIGRSNLAAVSADSGAVYCFYSRPCMDWINANPGTNALYDAMASTLDGSLPHFLRITGDTTFEDLSEFDLSDDGYDLDGNYTGDVRDTYQSPNVARLASGETVFTFARSYSRPEDLGDQGTVCRIKIFTSTGTLLADFSTALFDLNTVGNGLGMGDSPRVLEIGYAPGGYHYLWYSATNSGVYVFGQAAINTPIEQDVTPPYIIKRILTSPHFGFATQSLFGFAITAESIDEATYSDAVQHCLDENILISVTYTNQDNLLSILNDLLALYGGTLAEQGGQIYFDTFRANDVPLRVIDNHHLISKGDGAAPVSVTKGAVQDGYNSVQYQFYDRTMDYKQNQVTLSDEVDIDINGPRNKNYPSKFVMTGSLAMVVAERALWSNLYGRDNYDFDLGWKDGDLRPGLQITLVDSYHPSLQHGVRVVINDWQEQTRGVFSVKATRVFANHLTAQHGYVSTASWSDGPSSNVYPVEPMQYTHAYELPAEFQGSDAFMYFGYLMDAPLMGAQLYVSHDLGANYALTQDVQPFVVAGRLGTALPMRPPGYMEEKIDLKIFPSSGYSVATPTFVTSYTFDDATASVRASGAATIIVGSEAMAMEGLTLLGQNHYRVEKLYRGWGGTPIAQQNSGSYWHEHAAGIFALPINQDDIGTTLFYKIAGYNFAGKVYDISSIAAQSYVVKGVRWLSREMSKVKVFVNSAATWSANTPLNGPYVKGHSDVSIAWPAVSNVDGYGAGGYGSGQFGHWEPDVTGVTLPSYRVEVRSSNGVTVRSTVVYTGYFTYDALTNSADFGGFANSLDFVVTPFNTKGDGPVAGAASVRMF